MVRMIYPMLLLAMLPACSERAEDHAERTGNAVAADLEDATRNVSDSVDRLAERFGERVDRIGDRVADDAANRVEAHVGNEIDRAADEAGAALERVGDAIRDRDERPAR